METPKEEPDEVEPENIDGNKPIIIPDIFPQGTNVTIISGDYVAGTKTEVDGDYYENVHTKGNVEVKGTIDTIDVSGDIKADNINIGGQMSVNNTVNYHYDAPESKQKLLFSRIHAPTRYFTGREELLLQIEQAFPKNSRGITIQSILGLGGIGKTQLALRYAQLHNNIYKHQFLINATNKTELQNNLANLAVDLQGAGLHIPLEVRLAQTKNWLQNNPNWLLILDSADELTPNDVQEVIDVNSEGHILITSRKRNWESIGYITHMSVLPEKKAVELLEKITGIPNTTNTQLLAKELGNLPLALSIAGAYIRNRKDVGATYKTYLRNFKSKKSEMLDAEEKIVKTELDYEETIETVWDITKVQVLEESEAAYELLNLISFFASDDIPLQLLEYGKDTLPEIIQTSGISSAIYVLQAYSMLEINDELIAIHKLVQQSIQSQLSDSEKNRFILTSINLIEKVTPYDQSNTETWEPTEQMLTHALSVGSYTHSHSDSQYKLASIYNRIGNYTMLVQENYSLALNIFQNQLQIIETLYGKGHVETAVPLDNLGKLYEKLGDYQKAIMFLKQSLDIDKQAFGTESTEVAISHINLGNAFASSGDTGSAVEHLITALTIFKHIEDMYRQEVPTALNLLGQMFIATGKYQEALEQLSLSHEINISLYGENHIYTARDYNSLGGVFEHTGEFEKALEYFQKALVIFQQHFGFNHQHTVTIQNNIDRVEALI